MTLILALANRDQVIQLSDRRLTLDKGIPFEDSNKATMVAQLITQISVAMTPVIVTTGTNSNDAPIIGVGKNPD